MTESNCPNFSDCKLINQEDFLSDIKQKDFYLEAYCISVESNWTNCLRYVAKNELGLCPDFVLPDSNMTLDEIIDKFDEMINNRSNQNN